MAKFANGQTYRPGNDNLNTQQFTHAHSSNSAGLSTGHALNKHQPQTEKREVTAQHRGEKGGKWKKKGRQRKRGRK